jgi:hypothetical protein
VKIIAIAALVAVTVSTSAYAAAEPEAAPPQTPKVDQSSSSMETSDQDADAFRLGVIGGIGFPRPLALEAMVKIDRVVALGLEYSLLPKASFGGVDARLWGLAADARVFPFRGAFFVGLRAGRQVIDARATVDVASYGSFSESARAETWFVNPRAGFLWTWRSGFTVGLDAGVQIPLSNTRSSSLPAGLPIDVDSTIASIVGPFGGSVTPTVDLLRIGFLF